MNSPRKTNYDADEMDDDVLLLIKFNGILKIINENVFVQNPNLIKRDLCNAKSAFLIALVNEPILLWRKTPEKNKTRLDFELQIERFEEFIRAESQEINEAYQQYI